MPYIGNSPKNNVRDRFYYDATAGQTTFSGADKNGRTLAYQDGKYVDVYLNGVLLEFTTDYTAGTKTSVTLVEAAAADDLIEIIAYGIFSVSDTVSATRGGTFEGNINVTGDLTVEDGQIQATASGNEPYLADRLSDDGTLFDFRQDGTTVGTIGVESGDNFYLATGSTPNTGINFKTNFIAPCGSTGSQRDNAIDLGDSAAGFKDLYLGGGVYLGGTGSTHYLDDYEEGTYTVTVTPSTSGSITLASSVNLLAYTKVGRQVTITGRFQISSVSSPVGNARVSLPFTVAAGSEQSHYTALHLLTHDVNLPADFVQGFVETDDGISYATMYYTRDNGAWNPLPASSFDGSGSEFIYITGTFLAA